MRSHPPKNKKKAAKEAAKSAAAKKRVVPKQVMPDTPMEKAQLIYEKCAAEAVTLGVLVFRLQGIELAAGCINQLTEHAAFHKQQYLRLRFAYR